MLKTNDDCIKKARSYFIMTGNTSDIVKREITESWIRCKKYKVDPKGGRVYSLDKEELSKKLNENGELITVASYIMENLYKTVEGSGFSIILTDKEGYILKVIGDKDVMNKGEEMNFVEGSLWNEEEVGTNAIGTSLYLDAPIQTIGAEHYRERQHSWSCSATTIHDEEGNIIGCLDMSGNAEDAHPHTLGMVLTAAYYIEKQLALVRSNKLLNATFQSISEGMIILDENFIIKRVNETACKILKYTAFQILNMDIKEIIYDKDFINEQIIKNKFYHNLDSDFTVKGNKKVKCNMNAVPILINNKLIGVVITFSKASSLHKVANRVVGYNAIYNFKDIVTKNHKVKETIKYAKKASLSSCNVLIQGESGTGKELFAQSIHNYSSRADGPFIAVNCASIPKELMESELFGYEKGAFTGALKEGHPGKFELAEGGTIFLDEIGEMPLDMQSKLLRVLDNKKVCRIGGTYEKRLNVKVIAATNRDLLKEIEKKNFREDLYYRLNVMNIKIIPLRERREDIELLLNYFINRLNKEHCKEKKYTKGYLEVLKGNLWRGNIRELQNVVERSYYLSENDLIDEEVIYSEGDRTSKELEENYNIVKVESVERDNIEKALLKCGGNVLNAANLLGISRATIYRKINKYDIDVKNKLSNSQK